jgi:hypothetical protein
MAFPPIHPGSSGDGSLDMRHFEALRTKISQRLREVGTKHARRQIEEFPWLYGALGQVPSEVMLVCENPSLTGVGRADTRTISGGAPGIEDQWCGGPRSNCIKRLRPTLCELDLKRTPPLQPGGWRCYIINVIKEADVVRDFTARNKPQIAAEWPMSCPGSSRRSRRAYYSPSGTAPRPSFGGCRRAGCSQRPCALIR